MSSEALVTVVIPASRRGGMLSEAIASVDAQTLDSSEVNLIINRATRWLPNKINESVAASRSKYVLILCDDDKLEPTYLARVIEEAEKGFDVVSTYLQTFGDLEVTWAPQPFTLQTFKYTTGPWITSLVTRKLWDEVGGYDPTMTYADYEFWYRCFKAGAKASYLNDPLFLYRIHAGQGSKHVSPENARAEIHRKHPELLAP